MDDITKQSVYEAIKNELNNDPEQLGYNSGNKTDQEIADLMNNSYSNNLPPRVNQILIGIPYAPNVFTADDIVNAKAS